MSWPSEQITKAKKSSQDDSEYYSKLVTESEDGSTASEEDMFLSIQYPSPPYFPTPYLHNQDFRDPDKALKYIMKHFNLKTIHNSIQRFLISQRILSMQIPSWTQIVSYSSNDKLINQLLNAMPIFKNGQNIMPDTFNPTLIL